MNDPFNSEQDPFLQSPSNGGFPPKPQVTERKDNAMIRSLISLFIYGLFFYFLFDSNIAYIAAILLVIIVHEMGHFLFMKLFNYSNVKIFIVPLLGAFTSGKKQQVSQWQLSVIILAGPLPGIIIGCALFFLNKGWHNESVSVLYKSFLLINLFNCLPIHPLDGGRLVETLFFKENFTIRLVFTIISIIALLSLFIYFLSPVLLILPALLGLELYNENKNQKIRDYLAHERINYRVDYNGLSDKDYWLIRDCLLFSFPKKYIGITPGQHNYSMAEPLLVQHIEAVLQVNLKADLNLFKRLLVLLFYIFIFIAPIILFVLFRK